MIRALLWIVFSVLLMVGSVYTAAWMSVPITQREGETGRLISDYRSVAASVDSAAIETDMRRLSSHTSRMTGYPGADQAADYIQSRFESMGFAPVDSVRFWRSDEALRSTSEAFPTVVPVDKGAWLSLSDGAGADSIALYPLWPNLIRTSTVAPQGLSGALIYGGDGVPERFNGQPVEGHIALMEFNSGHNWLTAASLGVSAIVFIEPEQTSRGEAERKFLSTPSDIPRFWVKRDQGLALKDRILDGARAGHYPQVRIYSRTDWETVAARNIYAFLPGTDRAVRSELIVLEAYYDAASVTPSLAPGAEQTAGVAVLLEMARFLRERPIKRPVLFMASSGHHQALSGARSFVNRHLRNPEHTYSVELFLALDLTTGSDRLGLLYKGHYYDQIQRFLQPWVSSIGRRMTVLAGEVGAALGMDPERMIVDGINPAKGRTWPTYIPGFFALDSEPVMLAGRPGLALVTVEDARQRIDTPLDTFERVRMDNLLRQTRALVCVLPNLLNTSAPMVTKKLTDLWATLSGRVVEFDVSANILPDRPVPGALATVSSYMTSKTLMGVRAIPVAPVDGQGRFVFEGMPTVRGVGRERGAVEVTAYRLDPETGEIIYAPDRGEQGAGSFPIGRPIISARREAVVVVFRCRSMNLFDLVDQRYFSPLQEMAIYDAGTNGQPFIYGYAFPTFGMADAPLPTMVVFGQSDARFRITMGSGRAGRQFLLLNATPDDPDGRGFRPGRSYGEGDTLRETPGYIPYQAGLDMWTLDDFRIRRFREHGIVNHQVNRLHQTAGALLERAKTARQEKRYDAFVTDAKAAWSVESRAYPDILGTVNDSVIGVLFYLALLLPFSYFAERLLIAARRVEGRIIGMFSAFSILFLCLQAVHPAFAITLTPMIVLLAFLIIAMAITVIVIVVMKFESRLSSARSVSEGRHQDDVSRAGAMSTAATLGLSNMRHRPFRTLLTCVTLTLLTFSVMSFTSVIRYLRLNAIEFRNATPPYQGLLLRHRTWDFLNEEAYQVFRNEFSKQGPVAPRAWYYASRVGDLSFVDIRHEKTGDTFVAAALVGLTSEELRLRPRLADCLIAGRWIEAEKEEALVPLNIAQQLGIRPDALEETRIIVGGRSIPVVGLLDPERLDRMTDLDMETLTPVDFVQMSERRKNEGPVDPEEFEEYLHLPSKNVMFLSYPVVMNLGGGLMSIAIGLNDAEQVVEALDRLMPRTALTLFAGAGERVSMYSAIGSTDVGGLSDLLIPILIAGLIVMNTMLGSVYERAREIGVFNAVGLAPSHVGALFLAEAFVYAVLGVVFGYLMGQGVSHLIVRFDWLPGFELNVSSLAAVGASLLVMAVVMLSTLYPARLASRMAMPAVEMGWRIPAAIDDRITLELPFTVTGQHSLGLNMYLKEFLDAHREVAVGDFACESVELLTLNSDGKTGYRLPFTAWLVPYDLGVSQQVELRTLPTEDLSIYTLTLSLQRLSGDTSSWLRLNRTFLNVIRKQFLIWRTLGRDGQERYIMRGMENLNAVSGTEPVFRQDTHV